MHEPPASPTDCEEEGLRGIRLSKYRSPPQRLFQFLNTGVRTASEPRKSQICRAQELYCKAGRESHPCCEGLQAHQMLFPAYWGLWLVGFPSMSKWNHFVDKIILKIENPNTLLTSSFCSTVSTYLPDLPELGAASHQEASCSQCSPGRSCWAGHCSEWETSAPTGSWQKLKMCSAT